MKPIIFFLALISFATTVSAQSSDRTVGWFFNPEFSLMLHGDHVGNTVGFQTGVSVWNDHLQIGIFGYGRSGPINGQTYTVDLPAGNTYKGQSSLQVKADHGAFGLVIAPQFALGDSWQLDVPLAVGQMGAGFFLFGEDRNTPDGRRVSEWENELMNNADASFSMMYEAGIRAKRALGEHVSLMLGLHYTIAPGWNTYVGGTDFYNVPRVSVGLSFGD